MTSKAKQEFVFFEENEEVMEKLRFYISIENDFTNRFHFGTLEVILQKYQEQSNLLDPFLEEMVTLLSTPLLSYMRAFFEAREKEPSLTFSSHFSERESRHIFALFRVLALLTNTRGYKSVMKLLPHEVPALLLVPLAV